jgi:hypothetical protein
MPMDFVFYPKHEHRCPDVGHCPHLGGAALGTLVLAANEQNQYLAMLHGQRDEERRRNSTLFAENQNLREQLAQAQRELKAERQQRFCKDRPPGDKPDHPPERRGEGQHGHRVLDFFYRLTVDPARQLLHHLYSGP